MAGAASQAGDADSSRAPGLTSGLQGSVNVHRGALFVGATVTVHQFFYILHYHYGKIKMQSQRSLLLKVWLGYCLTPYQRLWLYNGAPLVAFYDTLGIRRTYSRLKPPASSRGLHYFNFNFRNLSRPVPLLCWVEFIGVLRHIQQYFSHICDGTDVQADWRSCTYGRAPNAIDISQGSLTCPSYTDTRPPFLYGDSDTLGIRRTYSRLKPPPVSSWGPSMCKRIDRHRP